MNHQDAKALRLIETRGAEQQVRKVRRLPCLLFLWLGVLVVCSAQAQVASHTPVMPQDALSTSAAFQPVGRAVVKVNGAVLTDRDLLREMYSIFPYARVHNGFPKAMEADIRAGALKMIVFEELVYQEAEHRKMTVPPEQVAQAMVQFRQQFNSSQQFQQFVQENFRGSQKLLQAKVERSLLIDKFLKQEVADKAAVTPADEKAYYDQHPDLFRLPESFTFQSISILPPANATPAQLEEVRRLAQSTLVQAKAAKSHDQFGLLAEKVSDDSFHVMMGEHKDADRSKLPPVVVNTLLAMQPGQISGLVTLGADAVTILRMGSHNPAGMRKFETVKDGLHQDLVQQKTEQLRKALFASLSKNAKIVKA